VQENLIQDSLQKLLTLGKEVMHDRDEWEADLMAIEVGKDQGNWKGTKQYEVLEGLNKTKLKPSIEDPPNLELKLFPSNLKYAFLAPSEKLPVIISASLSKNMEERLLRTLRAHTKAIGWSIHDIKGISLSICMHRIHMEEEFKPKA